MVSDRDRRELHVALERELGTGPATTLMELLPPVGWSDVARQSDLVAIRGEMAELRGELRGEMAELRTELKGEMAELRTELKGEMSELRGEMAELRTELKGEIAELRARVDGQLPRLMVANVASMIGVAGLVLAAAKLA
jgi:predicted nuclease with TOPRIM domain